MTEDNPKLRPVEAFPVTVEKQQMIKFFEGFSVFAIAKKCLRLGLQIFFLLLLRSNSRG